MICKGFEQPLRMHFIALLIALLSCLATSCSGKQSTEKINLSAEEMAQYKQNQQEWLRNLKEDMLLEDVLKPVQNYQQYFFQFKKSGHTYQYSEGKDPFTQLLFGFFFENGQLKSLLLNQSVTDFFYCRWGQSEQARKSQEQRGAWNEIRFEENVAWVRQKNQLGDDFNSLNTTILQGKKDSESNSSAEAIITTLAFAPFLPYALVGMAVSPDDESPDYSRPGFMLELAKQIKLGVTTREDLMQILGYPSTNLEKSQIWEYTHPDIRFGFVDGTVHWSQSRAKNWYAPVNSTTKTKSNYKCIPSN